MPRFHLVWLVVTWPRLRMALPHCWAHRTRSLLLHEASIPGASALGPSTRLVSAPRLCSRRPGAWAMHLFTCVSKTAQDPEEMDTRMDPPLARNWQPVECGGDQARSDVTGREVASARTCLKSPGDPRA